MRKLVAGMVVTVAALALVIMPVGADEFGGLALEPVPVGAPDELLIVTETYLQLVVSRGDLLLVDGNGNMPPLPGDIDYAIIELYPDEFIMRTYTGRECVDFINGCPAGFPRDDNGNKPGCGPDASGNCDGECAYCVGNSTRGNFCWYTGDPNHTCETHTGLGHGTVACGKKRYYSCSSGGAGGPAAPPNGCGCSNFIFHSNPDNVYCTNVGRCLVPVRSHPPN